MSGLNATWKNQILIVTRPPASCLRSSSQPCQSSLDWTICLVLSLCRTLAQSIQCCSEIVYQKIIPMLPSTYRSFWPRPHFCWEVWCWSASWSGLPSSSFSLWRIGPTSAGYFLKHKKRIDKIIMNIFHHKNANIGNGQASFC